jgi:hypothetical protein
MPVLLHKSVRELGRLPKVRDAIEDARKIFRSNNETFNCQPDKLRPGIPRLHEKASLFLEKVRLLLTYFRKATSARFGHSRRSAKAIHVRSSFYALKMT